MFTYSPKLGLSVATSWDLTTVGECAGLRLTLSEGAMI